MINGFENITTEELLLQYSKTKRHDIKCELVTRYVPVIRSVAIQMRNVFMSFAEVDDIINEGVLVLMSAVDRFDPALDVKFDTYISKRIRGMIIDLARKQDWIPRNVRKRAKTIDNITSELYNEKGSMPDESEIADRAGITVEQYRKYTKQRSVFNILSLDTLMEETENAQSVQIESKDISVAPETVSLRDEMKEMLKKAIDTLKPNEQIIISLYYVDELSMKDIAGVLNLSEPRISQIHSKALKKLRENMKSYME